MVPAAASTSRSASPGESVRGRRRWRRGSSSSAAGFSATAAIRTRWRKSERIDATRRAIVAGERPEARSSASQRSSSSVVADARGLPSHSARAVRSRRYASTVRGASRAAERARNASSSGSRVRAVIDAAESPPVDVAVDLGRGEGAVAEELLDRPQVGAALEQMRGKRMAEPVWVGEEAAQRARVQPLATRRDEKGVLRAPGQLRAHLKPAAEPVGGLLAQRDDALLRALAEDADGLTVEVDVAEVEVDGFAASQSRRVDQLADCAIADLERRAGAERLELLVDLVGLGRRGQAAAAARRERSVGNAGATEREAEEGADRGELARDRRGSEPAWGAAGARGAEAGGVLREHSNVDVVDGEAAMLEPATELLHVEAIGAAGGFRQRGTGEIPLDCGLRVHLGTIRAGEGRVLPCAVSPGDRSRRCGPSGHGALRLPRRDLCERASASDGDGIRPGQGALSDAGGRRGRPG